jgi:hypothetical protein
VFLARCDILGGQVLIWASQVVGVHNTAEGIEVHYTCPCGQPGALLTGSSVPIATTKHGARAA